MIIKLSFTGDPSHRVHHRVHLYHRVHVRVHHVHRVPVRVYG